MATRSKIGYIDSDDNSIRAVYCHWDGYPENNGRILLDFYSEAAKVKELVELGDMSSLGESIEDTEYYGRDRGERDVDAETYTTMTEWIEGDNSGAEYFYLFSPKTSLWMVYGRWSEKWFQVTKDWVANPVEQEA